MSQTKFDITDQAELVALLRQGKIEEFNECRKYIPVEIAGMGFREPDLSGVDLHGLDLTGVDFSSVDLSNANLSETKLVRANFHWAKLSGANLEGADLRHSKMGLALIDGAFIQGANFWGVQEMSDDARKSILRHIEQSWGQRIRYRKAGNCMAVWEPAHS